MKRYVKSAEDVTSRDEVRLVLQKLSAIISKNFIKDVKKNTGMSISYLEMHEDFGLTDDCDKIYGLYNTDDLQFLRGFGYNVVDLDGGYAYISEYNLGVEYEEENYANTTIQKPEEIYRLLMDTFCRGYEHAMDFRIQVPRPGEYTPTPVPTNISEINLGNVSLKDLVIDDFIERLYRSEEADLIDIPKIKLSNIKESKSSVYTLKQIKKLLEDSYIEQEEGALVIDFTATYPPTGISIDLSSEYMIFNNELVATADVVDLDDADFTYSTIHELLGN